MEELFRFSVLRPADRSDPQTIDLQRPPPGGTYIAAPPRTFAQQLQDAAQNAVQVGQAVAAIPGSDQNANSVVWAALENLARTYLTTAQNYASINQNVTASVLFDAVDSTQLSFDAFKSFFDQLSAFLAGSASTLAWQGFSASLTSSWSADAKAIATAYTSYWAGAKTSAAAGRPNSSNYLTQLQNWKYDLGDVFLALLIIRANGPLNIRTWISTLAMKTPAYWSIIAFFTNRPTLREIGDVIRTIGLLLTDPTTLKTVSDVETILNETILLPPAVFSWLQKPVHAIGLREFHVVKQHIRGYQLGEIATIENILKGESREHKTKHTLSNETDTFNQTVTTNETDKELDNTDQVDIKNEADNQVKEDTKVDGAVHASYDGGTFKLQADLSASYDKSSDSTQKFASDVSKSTTQKSVSKVTTQVTQSQTTKVIETWEEDENHAFDNKSGKDHVSGIYQWVEKVYLSQTFNLGRHLVFDMMVPEPGASLIAMATQIGSSKNAPTPPPPLKWVSFPATPTTPSRPLENDDDIDKLTAAKAIIHDLSPADLDPDELEDPDPVTNVIPGSGIPYYTWIGRFAVTGNSASPAKYLSTGKGYSQDSQGGADIVVDDSIQLTDGYEALGAFVQFGWKHRGGNNETGSVQVRIAGSAVIATEAGGASLPSISAKKLPNSGDGDKASYYVDPSVYKDLTQDAAAPPPGSTKTQITIAVPVSITAPNIGSVSVNIEIRCRRLPSLLRQWQLQTYEKIVTGWQTLQSDYQTALKGAQILGDTSVGPLGASDPTANRLTERLELKRACIAIMDNDNSTVRGIAPDVAVQDSPPNPLQPPPELDPYAPTLPEPILVPTSKGTLAEILGPRVRWFEQAFEWENMAYISYPYFWGRRSGWLEGLNLKLQYDDPLFMTFLQAGYTRVVVPVRIGFEASVHCFLHLGRPWLGGELPLIGDISRHPLYLDIAEEIKANTGGGEDSDLDIPVGNPWEYTLPTTLIKLRKDGAIQDPLPSWVRIGPNPSSAAPPKLGQDPNFPSDPPIGPWTWQEENPAKTLPYSTS